MNIILVSSRLKTAKTLHVTPRFLLWAVFVLVFLSFVTSFVFSWVGIRFNLPFASDLVTMVQQQHNQKTEEYLRENVSSMAVKLGEMQAQDYSGIELNNFYVDNCAMQLVLNPGQFDVVLTNNIFGDILSDEASVIAGSIGMLPSASLGDSTGMYEPIHGSAPDIAGQGIANPLGTIYSVAMMLRYSLDQDAAADAIEAAIDRVLEKGYRTPDLCGEGLTKVSTSQMGQLIAAELA